MGNLLSCFCGSDTNEDEVDESNLPLLHGSLNIKVIRAENLPDTDTVFFNIDSKDVTDPYVTGELGTARLFKTKYIANELNPVWDETFHIYVCHRANSLIINVRDKEHIGGQFIASCQIRVADLLSEEPVQGWFDLINGDKMHGRIELEVQYLSKESIEEDKGLEVVKSYFPMWENNRVVLYQDAETPQLPVFDAVVFPDGSPYKATTCWKDMYKAISEAQKFIYITGWSVYTQIKLVRDEDVDPDGLSHVGDLLKRKDAEGVKVLLMVWNEKLSTDSSPGLMGTHDEETRAFFAGTSVTCVMVSRMKREGVLASNFVGTCYTHHQKTVIVDAPIEGTDLRRIVAFIGGLDITDGRYDTPEFHLWKTISSVHAGEFYNNCVPGATAQTGPREPWHDCHAKVEGPAARDIMKNFEERWRRQAEMNESSLISLSEDEFASTDTEAFMPDYEGGPWNVQLFRSITADSCLFDLDQQRCLHSKDGKLVENSIMRCMVQMIRNSKNFVYLENQYFLGSAYSWMADQSTLTMHVIPREIAQKIVDKIAAGEAFKAYILIPMFPEGDPSSAAIQEILYWQFRTMEAMYRRIALAIAEFAPDSGAHPTDYLNFYCLGKRESPDEIPEGEFEDPLSGSLPEAVRKSQRHCIYVHSKMTIFDDHYVLVGSANVNQRSLGGNRDSEIAIGAHQPDHTVEAEGDPRGDVHTYRMALWAAHLGGADEAYLNPASDECLAKVREVTQAFWELYTGDEPLHSDVHMLPYPMKVSEEGRVSSLDPPFDCFPDTSAKVLGAKSGYLPGKLTT